MPSDPSIYPLVQLRWKDSEAHLGWQSMDSREPDLLCETTGYLIGEGDNVLCIAHTWEPDNPESEFLGKLYIPTCAIIERWEIDFK